MKMTPKIHPHCSLVLTGNLPYRETFLLQKTSSYPPKNTQTIVLHNMPHYLESNVPHERPSVSEVRRPALRARTRCGG